MTTLHAALDICRALKSATGIKVSRHFEGFFADRLVQSFAQPTLLDAVEHLAKSLDAGTEYVGGQRTAAFIAAAHAPAVLVEPRTGRVPECGRPLPRPATKRH